MTEIKSFLAIVNNVYPTNSKFFTKDKEKQFLSNRLLSHYPFDDFRLNLQNDPTNYYCKSVGTKR